jgi:hypothetical protein
MQVEIFSLLPFDSVSLEEGAYVFQQHHQVKRIRRRLFKVEPAVPRLRNLMLGVHKQNTGADRLGRTDAAQEDVLEERAAQTRPLMLSVTASLARRIAGMGRERGWRLSARARSLLRGHLGCSERVVVDEGLPATLQSRLLSTRYGHLMPGNEDEAVALVDTYLARAAADQRLGELRL